VSRLPPGTPVTGEPTVEVHVTPADVRAALEHDTAVGLSAPQKWLPPVWFYDDRGSELFDRITRLPEYYPTRAERRLLECHAAEIAARCRADTLVELGAGTCDKSRILLDALRTQGCLERFVPLDVSEATLRWSAAILATSYPGLAVHAVVGDLHRHLDRMPHGGRRLVAFLGGTIGNLVPEQRRRFLFDLDCQLEAGDSFLLGADLVKDPERLVAAYDDAAGVTAAFNRNVLLVLDRELDATFDPATFEHVALWDAERSWIEMRLRSTIEQVVHVGALGMDVHFAEGEDLRTEISAKFTARDLQRELHDAGFVVDAMWDQPGGDFLLVLASPYC